MTSSLEGVLLTFLLLIWNLRHRGSISLIWLLSKWNKSQPDYQTDVFFFFNFEKLFANKTPHNYNIWEIISLTLGLYQVNF
jgi:hypothetical protein